MVLSLSADFVKVFPKCNHKCIFINRSSLQTGHKDTSSLGERLVLPRPGAAAPPGAKSCGSTPAMS